jgi:hypothetical protein
MTERHIHQEIDFVCVLCGADLMPAPDAPPTIGVQANEETGTKEAIS